MKLDLYKMVCWSISVVSSWFWYYDKLYKFYKFVIFGWFSVFFYSWSNSVFCTFDDFSSGSSTFSEIWAVISDFYSFLTFSAYYYYFLVLLPSILSVFSLLAYFGAATLTGIYHVFLTWDRSCTTMLFSADSFGVSPSESLSFFVSGMKLITYLQF